MLKVDRRFFFVPLLLLSLFLSTCDVITNAIHSTETYTVTVTAGTGGTVAISPQKTTYSYNDVITITATPATGHDFQSWSGSIVSTDNPLVLTITKNTSLIANWTVATVSVSGVTLSQSSMTLTVGGSAGTLTATLTPPSATNQDVTWAISPSGIANVSGAGLSATVTPVGQGSATITVTTADGNKTATCGVTVTASGVPVAGVSLSQTSLSMVLGAGSVSLSATISPSGATNQAVTWSSDYPGIAMVSGGGLTASVTPVAVGTATITVTTADGNKTATCSVSVMATAPNIISPTFSINDTTNYSVLSLCIGKSYSSGSFIYGVAKIQYKGSSSLSYITVNASFMKSDNTLVFSDSSYVDNRTVRGSSATYNNGSFFTQTYNIGYYTIIEDLSTYGAALSDIAKVSLSISASASSYTPPLGHLSVSGSGYRDEYYDAVLQNVVNDGSVAVDISFPTFIYEDSLGRVFDFDFPDLYVAGYSATTLNPGASGTLEADYVTPDYLTAGLTLHDVILSWSPAAAKTISVPKTLFDGSLGRDKRNMLLKEYIDAATRATAP